MEGGEAMNMDFNSFLLLIVAVELALIYVKIPKK
jgi:hypothetical protein